MRKFYVSALLFTLPLMLTACGTPTASEPQHEVKIENSTLIFDGPISERAVAQVRALDAQYTIDTIQVNSRGGDPLAALQLGNWIHRQGMDIEVKGVCLQACANYLFTAAVNKKLHPDAVVAWSGGALHESWTQQYRRYLFPGVRHVMEQYGDRFLRREVRFFERIGVDQQITLHGYDEIYGCMNDTYIGFYYSIPQLLGMGVGNISQPTDNWQTAFEHYGEQFCKVELTY